MGPACRGKREGASRRTIEAMLPADHLLRRVDRCLDIGELRQALAGHYSARGRPSIDPELLIRMALVGRIYAITSERRLCEELRYNLAYRWFCRLAPGDKVPHHSTFSKNRHGRFRDADVFRILFEQTVRRSANAGMIVHKDAAVDASFVAEIEHDEQAVSILRSVAALGTTLNIPVLAEGVETQNQLDFLREFDCDFAQGFLFGQPASLIGRREAEAA